MQGFSPANSGNSLAFGLHSNAPAHLTEFPSQRCRRESRGNSTLPLAAGVQTYNDGNDYDSRPPNRLMSDGAERRNRA